MDSLESALALVTIARVLRLRSPDRQSSAGQTSMARSHHCQRQSVREDRIPMAAELSTLERSNQIELPSFLNSPVFMRVRGGLRTSCPQTATAVESAASYIT
jgi:hypothetical protein